jgi:hypothetical protein
MGLKPRDSLEAPFAQMMCSAKTALLFGSTHVQAAARLAVRFGAVPHDLSRKAKFRCDQRG